MCRLIELPITQISSKIFYIFNKSLVKGLEDRNNSMIDLPLLLLLFV
jgi:hypothetical protein